MSEILVSKKLTEALLEIENNIPSGLNTAPNESITANSQSIVRNGYEALKLHLDTISSELKISQFQLHFKMGRSNVHNRWKPHIWGALIPSSIKAPSKLTVQLYATRNAKIFGWGICPSDIARNNDMFMNTYKSILSENISDLENLFKMGFIGRGYEDNQTYLTAELFLKSESLTLAREYLISDLPDEAKTIQMMSDDIKKLLPIFNKVINVMNLSNLISVSEKSYGESDEDDEISKSLYTNWENWFSGQNDAAGRDVPLYLQKEFGTRWKSLSQLWNIGNREAKFAVEDAQVGKINDDRIQALLFGNLRRTAFSGGWRNAVKDNFVETLKCINSFVKENPKGCSNTQFESLVQQVKKITGYNLESFITRFLCDLSPNFYLPVSKFTISALQLASKEMNIPIEKEFSEDDYASICTSAQLLAKHLPEVGSEAQVYVFDHFLYWLELQEKQKAFAEEASEEKKLDSIKEEVRRYWKISSGRAGKYVNVHKDARAISIGWGGGVDIRKFESYESLLDFYKNIKEPGFDSGHAARQCWSFAKDIKKNDYVFAYGSGTILMVGVDKGNYDFKDVDSWAGNGTVVDQSHRHIRTIDWLTADTVETTKLNPVLKKKIERNQTIIELSEGEADEIIRLAGIDATNIVNDEWLEDSNTLSLADLCEKTSKSSDFFETLKRRLETKKQVVLFGPPGTSKTHIAKLFSSWFNQGDGIIKSVQFHPSYCYEDFIEGFRPTNEKSDRQFGLESGVFKDFCKYALRHQDQKHVFIIDEINRGNLPQIFGELLYLLEYRGEEATLPYSKSPFSIPANVFIVATMNSADRSIAMVDFALRRRFEFFDFPPDSNVLKNYLKKNGSKISEQKIVDLFEKLNSVISQELGKHYKIGHTYFMKSNLDENILREIWQFSVRPLLEEYFFDNESALELLSFDSLWEKKAEAA